MITRAVASIPETLDRVAHCLETGGRMFFMKGPECDSEIAAAQQIARRRRSGWWPTTHYQIPGTPHERRLVVYERLAGEAGAVASGGGRRDAGARPTAGRCAR